MSQTVLDDLRKTLPENNAPAVERSTGRTLNAPVLLVRRLPERTLGEHRRTAALRNQWHPYSCPATGAGAQRHGRGAHRRQGCALSRGIPFSVFTADLFAIGNDMDDRAAIAAVPPEAGPGGAWRRTA